VDVVIWTFFALITLYGYVMAILSLASIMHAKGLGGAVSTLFHLKGRKPVSQEGGDGGSGREAADELFFVLLVPALNEEQVIAKTLTSLLGLTGNFLILVVDDASDDGTVAAITPFLADERVRLLARPREEARTGKGDALNAGFAEARRLVHELGLAERYGAQNIVVVVFDSDGRVDPDFLRAVAPAFQDPRTAGVQSAVRMYNAGQNVLTSWQHLEFVVWGEIFLRAKDILGSATLGGNGQCVRLTALAGLGDAPWRPSLTEDLDLSLRLLIQGWRLRFCPSVAVWQEAVPSFRKLVRQRSRWLQGHVVSWNALPHLLRSRLPVHARLDLLVFLLLPAFFLPIGLASLGSWRAFWLGTGQWQVFDLLGSYLLGFALAPLTLWAWHRTEHPRVPRLLVYGHLFVLYAYVWLLASAEAGWNILLGRRSWAKTSRVSGQGLPQPAGIVRA
jgi:1,2-diacylglycerol 3-beta-glucosyltransferase